jgi:hypothetical protein
MIGLAPGMMRQPAVEGNAVSARSPAAARLAGQASGA